MRAVIPADNFDRHAVKGSAQTDEVCFHLHLPRGIFKKGYWLRFCVAKGTDLDSPGSPAPSCRQVARSITTKAVMLTLLCILLGETISILYLVKCLFGIDFFPDFHLLS
jgi:hypothetical protein